MSFYRRAGSGPRLYADCMVIFFPLHGPSIWRSLVFVPYHTIFRPFKKGVSCLHTCTNEAQYSSVVTNSHILPFPPYADPQGEEQRLHTSPQPLKKKTHKNIGFLSKTGQGPLKIIKLPSQHSMLGPHRHDSETPI